MTEQEMEITNIKQQHVQETTKLNKRVIQLEEEEQERLQPGMSMREWVEKALLIMKANKRSTPATRSFSCSQCGYTYKQSCLEGYILHLKNKHRTYITQIDNREVFLPVAGNSRDR